MITLHLCVFCGSQKKTGPLFPYTSLTARFL